MNSRSLNRATMPAGQAATLAVIYEVTAPKPGNVHRGADFEDVTYVDFIQSAVVIGPILERAAESGVGCTVLNAVQATREAVGTNTNLGTLLLLAPLACIPAGTPLAIGIDEVLCRLAFDDTRHVYEAIRLSSAGGLGRTANADVAAPPPADLHLVEAMRLAAERDLIARQYTNQFADVFNTANTIEAGIARGWPLTTSIVHAHIQQMAQEPDSLILRKCGPQIAEQSRAHAAQIIDSGLPGDERYDDSLTDFDRWLRADGHRRNPGTTADLIAAGLFVLLREGRLNWSTW